MEKEARPAEQAREATQARAMKAITRREWDAHWDQHFKVLRRKYPTMSLLKVQRKAVAETERLHGKRPSSMRGLLLKFASRYLVKGGDMDFSWTKNLWKGVKGALASSLTIAAIFGADALIQAFDTDAELTALGVPLWAVPLVLGGVAMIRNAIKHKQKRLAIP